MQSLWKTLNGYQQGHSNHEGCAQMCVHGDTRAHIHTNHVHLNREGPRGNQQKRGEENGRGWLKKWEAHTEWRESGEGWSHEQEEAERRAWTPAGLPLQRQERVYMDAWKETEKWRSIVQSICEHVTGITTGQFYRYFSLSQRNNT